MKPFSYKTTVALIYTVVLFLDRLDLNIVNITLPKLASVFDVPITSTDWVNLSFLLALAISIPISYWLGERFGFKKIYIIAIVLFGTGSTLCAFAPNLDTLIALRFIHGIGGGMLIPTGMTIVFRLFDKSEHASIASFTFIPSLIAPSIAPLLGGILLDTWGWQTVFLLSGPICLILAIITIKLLKESEVIKKPLDWQGFLLFSVMLMDVFYTSSLIGKSGDSTLILLSSLILCVLIYNFIAHEKKSAYPFIDLNYFKNDCFVKTNLIQLCFQSCHFGAIFLIGLYLQIGVGLSATIAGLIMGMQALGAITTSRASVKLFNLNKKLPLIIGFAGVGILSPCILLIHQNTLPFALTLFFFRRVFSGFCGTPIQTLSMISFNSEQIPIVSTLFTAGRQISVSMGVALSSGLMAMGLRSYPHDTLMIFGLGFFAIPVITLMGIGIVRSLRLP